MNILATGNLFDNPLVVLTILAAGAIASRLMKRRQERAARRSQGDESPEAEAQRPSQREMDLQEALRELLGGEPSPRAPQPPPLAPVQRDAQPPDVWSDEEQFQRDRTWMEEPQAIPEAVRPPPIQTAPRSQPHSAIEPVRPVRPAAQAARASGPLPRPATHAAAVVSARRKRGSRTGARAIALVRDARTVRQAFVASLVFGSPKAFETSRP